MAERAPTLAWVLAGAIFANMLLLILCGCKHPAPFTEDLRTEYFRDFPGPAARFKESDLVVVGTIVAVYSLGAPQQSKAESPTRMRFLIEPTHLTVSVERAFKRQPPSRIIDVYCYLYSLRNERQLGPLPFAPKTGQRRLMFLRSDGSRVRQFHDVFDYSLRVFSGRHDTIDPKFVASDGAVISWMLLTRGEGSAAEDFAIHLSQYAWYAHELTGTPIMLDLIERLTADPDYRVPDEATQILSSFKREIQRGREPYADVPR